METNQSWMNRLADAECRDSTYKPTSSPLVFSNAQGSLIWDVEGREYVDLCAGFGALPLGHNSIALRSLMQDFQRSMPPIEHGMGDVYPSTDKIQFLEVLKSLIPSVYSKGALALSGGQAVEIALKTAILFTKKSGFIAFDDGYHGLDLGVLPLTARADFRAPFKSWIAEDHVVRLPYGCSMDLIEEAIERLNGTCGFAAIVAEPIQGRAGIRLPPQDWLESLATTCHKHSGLLVLDEVFTGFGRIGIMSTSEDVDADILCFGKAIGGGFPISVCFAKDHIMNAWPESPGEALHTGTFFGHPLSAAVGRRTLEEVKKLSLCGRSLELGVTARNFLAENLASNQSVKEVRGRGLMIGIEYTESGKAAQLMDTLRGHGVIVLPSGSTGSVLSITPALNIPEELLIAALQKIVELS